MDNTKLEAYAQNILSQYKGLFEKVKEINTDLINNNDIQNVSRYYTYQDTLTGIFGTLIVAFKQMRAFKENQEAEYYYKMKVAADYNNEKFVSATADKESSLYIGPLRMARDILEGNIEATVKAIDTCRSHIWEHKKEQKYDTSVEQ